MAALEVEGKGEALEDVVNFSGSYITNKQKSDSIEPLLKCFGVPWIGRKAANKGRPIEIIEHKPRPEDGSTPSISVTNKSAFRTSTSVYLIGEGEISEYKRGDGKLGKMACSVQDKGLFMRTITEEGDKVQWVVTTLYSFEEGSEGPILRKSISFYENPAQHAAGDAKCCVNRYFDRLPADASTDMIAADEK